MAWGLLFDAVARSFFKYRELTPDIHSLCVKEGCHCDEGKREFKDMHEVHDLKEHAHNRHHGIVKPALRHTIRIFAFILVFSVLLNYLVETWGEESIRAFFEKQGIFVHFAAGLLGLIPNCAASVLITEFFMDGIIGFGSLMSGLLVGAGVGILVLFRMNRDIKKNLMLTAALYFSGVLTGIVTDIVNISL